ncbi:MAG: autotransporter outer membrane beta-barrel domain-containing protein [bacterium]|nr:autotransporter outer membrane beta-barrel domain-containing protein [bacterium]
MRFEWKRLSWEPKLGVRYARLSQDGFEEEGAGAFNLAVDGRSSDGLESFVGLRLATGFRLLDERLEVAPEIHGEWAQQWLSDDRRIGASLPGLAQSSFHVRGDGRAGQEWSTGIGLVAHWNERLRFELQYDFHRGRDEFRSHALVGGLEWQF